MYSGNIAMNRLQPQPLQDVTNRSGGDGGTDTKQNPSTTTVVSSSHSSSATSDELRPAANVDESTLAIVESSAIANASSNAHAETSGDIYDVHIEQLFQYSRDLGEERSVTCVGTTTASTAAKRRRLNSGEHQLMCDITHAIDPIPISGIMMGPNPKYTKSRIIKDLGAASIMKMKHLKKRCDMAKDALAMMQEGRGPSFIQYMLQSSTSQNLAQVADIISSYIASEKEKLENQRIKLEKFLAHTNKSSHAVSICSSRCCPSSIVDTHASKATALGSSPSADANSENSRTSLPVDKQNTIDSYEEKKNWYVTTYRDFFDEAASSLDDDDGKNLFTVEEAWLETIKDCKEVLSEDDVMYEAVISELFSQMSRENILYDAAATERGGGGGALDDIPSGRNDVNDLLNEACHKQSQRGRYVPTSVLDIFLKEDMRDLYLKTRSLRGITDEQAFMNACSFMKRMGVPDERIVPLVKEMVWKYFESITFKPERRLPAAKISKEMEMEDKRKRDEFRQQSQESDSLIHDPQGTVYRANVSDVSRPGDSIFVLLLHCRTSDGQGGVCAAEGVHSINGVDFARQCCTVRMADELSKWFESSLVCGEAAANFVGANVLPNCTRTECGYGPCPDIDPGQGKRSAEEVNKFFQHMMKRGIFIAGITETGTSSKALTNFVPYLSDEVKAKLTIGDSPPHPCTFSVPIPGMLLEDQLVRNVNHIEHVEASLRAFVDEYNKEYKKHGFHVSLPDQESDSLRSFCLKNGNMPFISDNVEAMKGALKVMKLNIQQRVMFFVMLHTKYGATPLMTLLQEVEMPDNCMYYIMSKKEEMIKEFKLSDESELTVGHVLRYMRSRGGKASMALDGYTADGKSKRAVAMGEASMRDGDARTNKLSLLSLSKGGIAVHANMQEDLSMFLVAPHVG